MNWVKFLDRKTNMQKYVEFLYTNHKISERESKTISLTIILKKKKVQYMKQGTQSWYTGTTQRRGMGREVGGRFGRGDTCTLVADSCQCMAKTTTIL